MSPFDVDPESLVDIPIDNPPLLFPGVYVFWDASGAPLYVGESGDVVRRRQEHKRSKKWFAKVAKTSALKLARPQDRLVAETTLILHLRPKYNKAIKIGIANDGGLFSLQFLRSKRA